MVCKIILIVFLQGMVTVGILPQPQKLTDQGAAEKATVIYIVVPKAEAQSNFMSTGTWVLVSITSILGIIGGIKKIYGKNNRQSKRSI